MSCFLIVEIIIVIILSSTYVFFIHFKAVIYPCEAAGIMRSRKNDILSDFKLCACMQNILVIGQSYPMMNYWQLQLRLGKEISIDTASVSC